MLPDHLTTTRIAVFLTQALCGRGEQLHPEFQWGSLGTHSPPVRGWRTLGNTTPKQTFPYGLAHPSQSERPNFYLWLGRKGAGPFSKRKMGRMQSYKRLSTLFLTPNVPSNSPEVVKGHRRETRLDWDGPRSRPLPRFSTLTWRYRKDKFQQRPASLRASRG